MERFRRALHPRGWPYLTVERVPEELVRKVNEEARRSGVPVVEGEVVWDEPDGYYYYYYYYYPTMQQVRAWVADAGFAIEEEAEGPWHVEGYAYHHVLACVETPRS